MKKIIIMVIGFMLTASVSFAGTSVDWPVSVIIYSDGSKAIHGCIQHTADTSTNNDYLLVYVDNGMLLITGKDSDDDFASGTTTDADMVAQARGISEYSHLRVYINSSSRITSYRVMQSSYLQ